jgi:hypothetical protein
MSSDTVFGQGTPPDPSDETYLSLLKKSVKPAKVIIKTEEEEDKEDKEVIDVHITKDDKKADLNASPSMY